MCGSTRRPLSQKTIDRIRAAMERFDWPADLRKEAEKLATHAEEALNTSVTPKLGKIVLRKLTNEELRMLRPSELAAAMGFPTKKKVAKHKLKKRAAKKAKKKAISSGQWFWISWYWTPSMGPFTLYCPWWVSGETDAPEEGTKTICAAVPAESEPEAKNVVNLAFDRPPGLAIEWRFCSPREAGCSPFSGRFPKAWWMKWPPKRRSRGKA